MAKTYVPLISYKDKLANVVSHIGTYAVVIGFAVAGLTSAYAKAIPEHVASILMSVGIVVGLVGFVGMGAGWVIAKIRARSKQQG